MHKERLHCFEEGDELRTPCHPLPAFRKILNFYPFHPVFCIRILCVLFAAVLLACQHCLGVLVRFRRATSKFWMILIPKAFRMTSPPVTLAPEPKEDAQNSSTFSKQEHLSEQTRTDPSFVLYLEAVGLKTTFVLEVTIQDPLSMVY